MTFSEKLIYLRKLKPGRTQQQAANGIGIPRCNLASYEESRAEPPFEVLKKISTYYNVTTDFLLGASEITELPEPIAYLFNKAPKGIKDSVLKLLV